MTKAKNRKPAHTPHGTTTPLLVYLTSGLGGVLGYLIGETVLIHQPHWVHWIPILPLGVAGYFIGKLIYKLRGYEDII